MKRPYRFIGFLTFVTLAFVTLANGLTKSCQSTSFEMGQTQKQACRAECTRVCSRAVGNWQQKCHCRCVLQSELQPGLIWEIHHRKVEGFSTWTDLELPSQFDIKFALNRCMSLLLNLYTCITRRSSWTSCASLCRRRSWWKSPLPKVGFLSRNSLLTLVGSSACLSWQWTNCIIQ